MKRIQTMIVVALMILGARAARADTLSGGDDGQTVIETVTTADGTITLTWLADANFAGSLGHDSPYWVDGINLDGSMSLSTATAFINNLNNNKYLGISNWRLPITIINDPSCSLTSPEGDTFAYNCGEPNYTTKEGAILVNPTYPYSELAGLFYNLGGQANNNIELVHNSSFSLFTNLQPYLYWSQTAQSNNIQYSNDFWFQNGFEGTEDEYDSLFVLPVSTTTGQEPDTTPACAATTPESCDVLRHGLGLDTVLVPTRSTLQVILGGRMIYDPTLDVSFLANANLASTLSHDSPYWVDGINQDGSMNTTTLAAFLAALNNPANPYLGITGWTIPAVETMNANCTIQPTDGNPDYGYNCDGPASPLGELFYDQMGGVAGHSAPLPGLVGIPPLEFYQPEPFDHLELNYYWQCGKCPPAAQDHPANPPSFSFLSGYQGLQSNPNELFVLLEVPGKVLFLKRPFPFPFPF
ncbi:MAG TPA: hypothetical protein VEN79_00870 [Terriglobia bacterium]|nr:hypothetical protein [Terriglobia bacterium]